MANVAASANDPIFLNHHAMVDCIFETWLQKNPSATYPTATKIPQGHRKQDYIVPFFPLYKHEDMFSTADKFGYRCEIKPYNPPWPWWYYFLITLAVVIFVSIIVAAICALVRWCWHKCKHGADPQNEDMSKMGKTNTNELYSRTDSVTDQVSPEYKSRSKAKTHNVFEDQGEESPLISNRNPVLV